MAEIEKLYGITEEEAAALSEAGMGTVSEFYEAAKHPDSRSDLSEKTGIEVFRLEELASVAGNFEMMMDCSWDDDDE